MSGKELSMALGDISDEKLQDALDVYKQKRKTRNIWLRATSVAAALALILTAFFAPGSDDGIVSAPGVLKVYAYDLTSGSDLESMVSYEMKEGVELPFAYSWNLLISCVPGLPLTLYIEKTNVRDGQVTFEVKTNGGEFLRKAKNNEHLIETYLGKEFTVQNGTTIYWINMEPARENATIGSVVILYDYVYVDIIIRENDNIIGYAVVKINRESEGTASYRAEIIECINYPAIEGKYQRISKAYVENQIENAKAETVGR